MSRNDQSDEQLTEDLLMAFECGAKLCDIREDLFDRCIGELTVNDKAVEKQQKLIEHVDFPFYIKPCEVTVEKISRQG